MRGEIRNTFIVYIRVNRRNKKLLEYEIVDAEELKSPLDSFSEVDYEKSKDGFLSGVIQLLEPPVSIIQGQFI